VSGAVSDLRRAVQCTRIVVVDDRRVYERHSIHDCRNRLRKVGTRDYLPGIPRKLHGPQNRQHRQPGRGTNKVRSARTVLNLGLEKIYTGMHVLLGIVPATRSRMTRPSKLLCKPWQPRLQRPVAQVVQQRCSVDAACMRKLQGT
jgi:hypothetical protein